jgi:toxin ParE1/3/4
MSLPIRFLPEARVEYDDAADWYEQRRSGLGLDFIARIRDVLGRISLNPQMHATIYRDVRKAVVTQFPFVVLYREDANEVVIISVFHTSRDPSAWQSRA